jgi:RNA polymerase primary sigma factor
MEPEWVRRLPPDLLASIKELVRVSRQMLHETGREPSPEELAERLASPLAQVRRRLKIAKEGIDPGEDAADL